MAIQAADREQIAIRTNPSPDCRSCGAGGVLLFSGLEDRIFAVPGVWSLRRCSRSDCGWVWLDPVPVPEDMHLLYWSYFTHAEDAPRLFRRIVEGIYRALNFLPSRALGLSRAKQRIDTMCLSDRSPGRLLDVGCGDGVFLVRMRRRGWKTRGIDLDTRAVERARTVHDLNVAVSDLEAAAFSDDAFDAVTASHVLEHVPDPMAFLAECLRIVRPSGRIVITTPNLDSLGFQRHQAAWMGLDPPRHLNLFSMRTLRRCAETAGARKIEVFSTAANAEVFFAVSLGIQAVGSHLLGRTDSPELLRPLKAVAWQYLEQLGLRSKPELGEEAVLVIEK